MLMPVLKKMPAQRLINLQSLAKINDVVFGPIAQWLEPRTHNPLVASSNLAGPILRCKGDTKPFLAKLGAVNRKNCSLFF